MNKIAITSDSGIDPIDMKNMIPAQIIENDKISYKDIIEIKQKEILERTKNGSIFKTSSPLLSDYENRFRKLLEEGYKIIHLSMSSGISEGSNTSSRLIANDLNEEYGEKIQVIDTLTGATGGTLISEIANDLVYEGYDYNQIIEYLEKIKRQIRTSFFVPNPEGFIRSGRNKSELCLKDKAILVGVKATKLAGIKFRVDFNEEGNLYTKSLVKARTNDGMMKMVRSIINEENKKEFENSYVVIGNVNEEKVDMYEIGLYLKKLEYFKKIIRKDINGVVAAYGSNDLCGISLVKKR